mmetsp:Transcript_4123/g.7573  ORF Transcript_4123/g.7573 Transcript_4123/m.7573 type:complete len:118 (+) Transcript_4123:68-421(+)
MVSENSQGYKSEESIIMSDDDSFVLLKDLDEEEASIPDTIEISRSYSSTISSGIDHLHEDVKDIVLDGKEQLPRKKEEERKHQALALFSLEMVFCLFFVILMAVVVGILWNRFTGPI